MIDDRRQRELNKLLKALVSEVKHLKRRVSELEGHPGEDVYQTTIRELKHGRWGYEPDSWEKAAEHIADMSDGKIREESARRGLTRAKFGKKVWLKMIQL